ncbi:NUDIX domain-containing protein [Profundibacterium mesophilum]|uniref:ADP-ribose pyrophosphatase n=1 Tax=Profundibacterium mesophilum KAUST100406-0324 TaxID=1037889 RepID=A0A921NRF5_9RHOB|nr:NUDIX hydrolase [Profundibacterium mesophilum]KAF0676340.1 ADP-ribose pyrophosphatase [Profundibacterium mesophilum KAUST100406-0324]
MIRRYGGRPEASRVYIPRPGAYAILLRAGQILLTWQGAQRRELQLPGGGIDPGESPIGALHREVFEETGWHIAAPRRLGAFRRHTYMPEYGIWAEKICHVYLARPTLRKAAPSEPDHVPVWLDPDEAAGSLATQGDREFLGRLLRSAAGRAARRG